MKAFISKTTTQLLKTFGIKTILSTNGLKLGVQYTYSSSTSLPIATLVITSPRSFSTLQPIAMHPSNY